MKPVRLLIVGAGSRGTTYAGYARQHPDQAVVVGVAEPRDYYRERLAQEHRIPATHVFRDWRQAADRPALADAVVIATQDAMHADPAVAFAGQGYHLLLEKPMAPDPRDCRRIYQAVAGTGRIFGTRGELCGDGSVLEHFDFLTDRWQTIDTRAADSSLLGGHGGGDCVLMHSFLAAVARGDPGLVLSGSEETLETHLIVFAAERARREGRVVSMDEA